MFGVNIKELFGTAGVGEKALLIGNGPSRKTKNLELLRDQYKVTVGCNILYKEFMPTFLFTQNTHILSEYFKHKVYKRTKIVYVDNTVANLNLSKYNHVRKRLFYVEHKMCKSYDSTTGLIAMYMLYKMGYKTIHLVGMDMDRHNVYRGKHAQYQYESSLHVWEDRRSEFAKYITYLGSRDVTVERI